MLSLIAEILLALIFGVLFIFVTILGERNQFRVQRGWYFVVFALGLMWMGSVLDLANGVYPFLSNNFFQNILKQLMGQIGGPLLLLIGLFLWAPAIAGSRERYLLRLKTSEHRYRILTEEATDMLAEHDLEGRFLFATQRSKQIVGYEPEELEGRSIYDFIDPDQLGIVQLEHRKILKHQETVRSTYKFRHKDGHYIWLESATRFFNPGGNDGEGRILAMSRDISERIHYEENLTNLNNDLKLQQKRIRILYELAATSHLTVNEQLEETLAAGAATLEMDLGIISHIKDDEFKVLYFYPEASTLAQNQVFKLADTYCSMTLEENAVVTINEMSQSPYASHPCWETFQLESYIGVPIHIQGEIYGTLSFSKTSPRAERFTGGDEDLVRLMGQWVSRVLEREQASQELSQSEERYKSIINSSMVGVILIDNEGMIQSFNAAAENIFGYNADEVIGKNVRHLMYDSTHAEDDNSLQHYLHTELTEFIGTSREVSALTKTGEEIYIELGVSEVSAGTHHYFSGTVMDITARKHAEENLANAHLRLKNVFNSATQVAIIATDLAGGITIFNPGAENMLGYTSEEVVGKSTSIFHLQAEVEKWARELSTQLEREIDGFETFVVLARLGGQVEHEWTYVRKDGSHLTVNSAVTALQDTSGSITGFLGIILDITSRKQAEEALKLAKSVAEESNQTKSDFLANMSHELRTPLNSVIGFSNILLKNSAQRLNKQDILYLERIQDNGTHLLRLINDILDLSKIESGRMDLELVELDIGEQILDLIQMVESQLQGKPVELIAKIPDNLLPLVTDPGKIRQILLNLISNAIKFTDEGAITITVIANQENNHVSEIRVADTGIGIPQDRLEKIFDEFTQVESGTQRKYGGTGLGLSISRRMCQIMGCILEVESEVGRGSTFIIKVSEQDISTQVENNKVRNAGATRSRTRRTTLPFDDLRGRRILIVDDDDDSQTLLKHYLSETGCKLDIADSAKEAFKAIRRHRPDLITLDLQMPLINGEKFLRALKAKKEYKRIPVVVVSIIAREYRGRLSGVVDFIPKPIHRQQLLWAIKRNLAIEGRRILIVEDDPDMRLTLSSYVGGLGVEIRSAESGSEALEIIQTSMPDLILLDLMMPGMNGQEFLGILRRNRRYDAIPVLVVTGKELSPTEELFFKAEAIPIILKSDNLEIEIRHQINEIFQG